MTRTTTRATRASGLRSLTLLSALSVTAALASGCIIEAGEGPAFGPRLADLEVRWTIGGVDCAELCATHGIKTWVVELRGAENRDVVLDCQASYWTTENDLLMLREGSYDVRVIALNHQEVEIARLETALDLCDRAPIEMLRFDFTPAQFR